MLNRFKGQLYRKWKKIIQLLLSENSLRKKFLDVSMKIGCGGNVANTFLFIFVFKFLLQFLEPLSSFVRRALTPVLALFKSAIHTTYLTPDRDYTLKHLRQNHRMCTRNSWLMIDVGDDMCISVEVLIICDNLLFVNSLWYCS